MKKYLLLISLSCAVIKGFSQTSYTWNGSLSTSWNTAGNWTPNGIPGSADNATIVTGGNTCKLSGATSINNLTLTSGTLDMGGFMLTVGGTTATFTAGTVQNGTLTVSAATTTTFGNGPVTMNCAVNITSAAITIRNTTFQQTVAITKNGATNDGSAGNNIFNGATVFTNAGSGYLLLANGNGDQFNNTATFNNTGSNNIYVAYNSTNNIFNGLTTFNNTPSTNNGIYVSPYSTGTAFNANIVVTSNNGTGVQFCSGNGTATATLAAGNTIKIGAGGFSGGSLLLRQFTQAGNAPISLTGTGSSVVYLGPSSNFGGTMTVTAPDIWAQGATYSSPVVFTKTGGSSNHNNQYQNIFNASCTINQQSSSGYFMLGYNSNDLFNDTIIVTSTGTGGTYLGWTSGTGTPTLAAGKTIQVGPAGFSAGYLYLNTFTQLGSAPMNLTFTGTSTGLYFARSSVIGGNLSITAPDIYFSGGTFNGTVTVSKTGANGDYSQGGNTFNGICSFTNGSSGYMVLGNSNPDIWNTDVTFTDNGSERILPAWGATGTQFNGNIYVNTAGSAQGIQFCGGNTTATATLAAGKTILPGSTGLTAGYLYLKQFTQAGNVPINLTATGSSVVYLGPTSNFGGAVTVTAPDIWAQGATYNSPAVFNKTGGSSNHNNQYQNIFNASCTINQQSSSGYFMLGYNSNDLFNDTIIVTCTGTGGIYLGWQSGTGTPTLAAGKTIQIGPAGFSAGFLYLNTFTQLGSAPINLTFTGTNTAMYFARSSVIGGNFSITAPDIYFNGCTFNGTLTSSKTGSGGDWSQGGNTFNGICSITNGSSGYEVLGNSSPDIWNNDVTFTDNGSERILPAWGATGTQFNGNIFVNTGGSAVGIEFCGGNGTSTATLAAGKTIQAGSTGLNAGYLILRQFTQLGNTPINLTMTSPATYLQFGPSTTLNGNVTTNTPGVLFDGCIFNGSVTSTKTGASNDAGSGNNIFNGTTTITQNGSGYLMLGNGNLDQFNDTTTFNNAGSANFYVAYNSSNNVFGGPTTFNNTPVTNTVMYVSSYSAGTTFNNNIVVNSTNGSGVQFCTGNATATATLAAGYTISVGSAGFTTGQLLLRQFTQTGATAQNLALTGTGILTIGPSSAFGGDITASSPTLYLNGCTYSGASTFTKTGITGDYSTGGNVFNGVCSITNSGTSYLLLGNVNPDIWNNDVTFTDNGSERLLPCWATTGNQFNGNIYVNTGGSAQGIQFCGGNNTATATQAAGKTIQTGATGLNAGYLQLRQFTQLGSAPVNLTMASTASYLQFGPSSAIGGNVVSTSPGLDFNGCTFSGTVTSTKTGASNDNSSGNNIFNGVTNLTNSGSGYLLLGNGNHDQFNTDATFNNTGSNSIYVAYNSINNTFGGQTTFTNTPTSNTGLIYVSSNSAGTVFNGNILVNSTNGQGVQFCSGNASATATLSSGYTISVGAAGFSAGTLLLRQFTQSGPMAQSLTLTGSGGLTFGPSSNMGGNMTTVSPTLLFNGCVFGGTVTSLKNGNTNDASIGNNTFDGVFTVTNTGAGYFMMGNGAPDTWQSTATFNNQSSGQHMYVAYSSTGNTFNGDVYFNNQPGSTGLWMFTNNGGVSTQFNGNIFVTNTNGAGVYFGNGTGTATLTGAVSVGAAGFNAGALIFRNFNQTGSAASNITTTGTSYIQYGTTAVFTGPVTSSSPGLFFNGTTFNSTVNCTKTGTTNDQSQGNNIFNGSSTFTNAGTGYLMMTNITPDAYNADVTFVKSNTGSIYPNYNNSSNYAGNLTVNSSTAITFGANTGTAVLTGTGTQNINATAGSTAPIFTRLVINNTGGGVTLNTPINVSGLLTFNSGLLNTTSTNLLIMLNGSVTAAGTALSTSYVNGPMRYQKSTAGPSTLNFPIGTAVDCRPVVLTVNHTGGTLYNYTATLYDASAQALNYVLPPSVTWVSHEHYYTISRTDNTGTSQPTANLNGNQTIQIFFGSNSIDDGVTDGSTLTIVKNTYLATTHWIDIGGTGGPAASGGASLTGSITSTSSPTAFNSFSTFAIANKINGTNVLPTELLYFDAKPDNNQVDLTWATATESNNSYFTVEKSKDGLTFESLARVNTQAPGGNSNQQLKYAAYDLSPYSGTSFYRLVQTDLDGNFKYSNIVSVNFTGATPLSIYPNPSMGTVYVTGLSDGVGSVKVEWYDLGGKLLVQEMATPQGGMIRLNTHFNNGDYILKVQRPDGSIVTTTVLFMK